MAEKRFAGTIWPNLSSALMVDEEMQLSGWTTKAVENIYRHEL